MDTLQGLRRANREIPVPEPPTPVDSAEVEIYEDKSRDGRRVTYAEFVKDWQGRGYRLLVGQRLADMPQPIERGRDIFPPLELLGASGQTGIWAAKESAAREHLNTHADRLAERLDRPPVPRQLPLLGKRPPHPARAVELAQAAITAEATALLWEEVDSLREEVAALRAALKERG